MLEYKIHKINKISDFLAIANKDKWESVANF